MVLLSKNKIQSVFGHFKGREERVFLAEGPKLVGGFARYFPVVSGSFTASQFRNI